MTGSERVRVQLALIRLRNDAEGLKREYARSIDAIVATLAPVAQAVSFGGPEAVDDTLLAVVSQACDAAYDLEGDCAIVVEFLRKLGLEDRHDRYEDKNYSSRSKIAQARVASRRARPEEEELR